MYKNLKGHLLREVDMADHAIAVVIDGSPTFDAFKTSATNNNVARAAVE